MEELSSKIDFPTIEQIVKINRQMIELSGGNFTEPENFRNRNSLEYILSAIAYPISGRDLFPSIEEKSAALGYEIMRVHVFTDGNKRTGSHVAWAFLKANNINIEIDASIEDLAVNMAAGSASRKDFVEWLYNHKR
ncbi:MAG: type II toxin-antitoxin system death-on-curing family toxin [Anaerolineae bacterium]|nr:type II toxin-antitoxin system death-on-curing family toxin [Anaerolineae bacterium]